MPYCPKFAVSATDALDTLRKSVLVDGLDVVADLEKSHGAWVVDARNGTEYLDFFTCIASMPVGFNHPAMLDDEFVSYLGHAALNKLANPDMYSAEYATFVKTFFELAVPKYFIHAFFIDGGSLAVENAIKAAMDWKVRKNIAKGLSDTLGSTVLHFEGSFHGRSGYTLSLTNTDPTKTAYFPKFDWPRVSSPYRAFPLTPENEAVTIAREEQTIKEIETAFENNPNDICSILIEPIQGEGGDRHFRPEFMAKLRELADTHEALLIFDEVQTGVGLTGHFWAHEGLGVQPDIISFGKKMQVCGILAGPRVDEVPDNVFRTSSRINSTWGGSLVDMVRVTKYLEIIADDNLVKNAKDVGAYLVEKLQELADGAGKGLVTAVRGMGLWAAFDLPNRELRTQFFKNALANGLLIVGSGSVSVRFRPPLTLTKEQVDEGVKRVEKSLIGLL